MDFLSFLTPEFAHGLLSQAAKSDLTEYLIVVAVVWRVMKKNVGEAFTTMQTQVFAHLTRIEQSVSSVATEMKSLKEAVTADLNTHSTRLQAVENGILELRNEVDGLKQLPKEKI
jgi:hypothetical protein